MAADLSRGSTLNRFGRDADSRLAVTVPESEKQNNLWSTLNGEVEVAIQVFEGFRFRFASQVMESRRVSPYQSVLT